MDDVNQLYIFLVQRNYDPKLHPFEVPREYQRAINAAKLDKIFAKPFLGALEGHTDVVQCMMKHPLSLSTIISGSCDGEVRLWNLPTRKCVRKINAYSSIVRGICAPQHGQYFFTIDNQAAIKQWTLQPEDEEDDEFDPNVPMNTIIGKQMTMGMHHHFKKPTVMEVQKLCCGIDVSHTKLDVCYQNNLGELFHLQVVIAIC